MEESHTSYLSIEQEKAREDLLKRIKKLEKKLSKSKKKKKLPERGMQTWFRLASQNLYTRSRIVDHKANILITTNAIIFSVVLGTLFIHLDQDKWLVYPIILLLITSIGSTAYAVFATRPKKVKDQSPDTLEQAEIMTFDDFYHLPKEEYEKLVEMVTSDEDFLYPTITRDIYKTGKDLHTRFANIRVAYDIFLYGIIISLVVFMVCQLTF